jgi:hypothetical protein
MSELAGSRLDFDDEDRLPWLEPATAFDEEEERVSFVRLALVALIGVAVLALIVGGVMMLRHYLTHMGGGEGTVIAAPRDSYKIPAAEADAKKFAGEGDASYATSEGLNREGRIDMSREPEAPVAATPIAGTTGAQSGAAGKMLTKPEARVTTEVADATRAGANRKPVLAGGSQIQLGAYGSEAIARDSWTKLAKRYAYLSSLTTSIQSVSIGSTTLYRLRAKATDSASALQLCGKLKAAGENCMVVN